MSKLLLYVLGWSVDSKTISDLNNLEKAILVYPHTTYADFLLLQLYINAYDLKDIYTVVNEKLYNKYTNVFKYLQCFPATAKQRTNGGFVNTTVICFSPLKQYKILISPEGTMLKCPWRSGYRYIAEGLNVPVYTVGFDYCTHELKAYLNEVTSECETSDNETSNHETSEQTLRKQFSNIVPLYPEHSDVPIIHSTTPSLIDWCTFTTVVCPLYPLYKLWRHNDKRNAMIVSIGYFLSWIYHHSHEHRLIRVEPIYVTGSMLFVVVNLILRKKANINMKVGILFLLALYTFLRGSRGRNRNSSRSHSSRSHSSRLHSCRTNTYINYHSVFHFFISLAFAKFIN